MSRELSSGEFSKTVVVTGAARGIGLAVAKRFLQEGYAVALLDNNQPELQRAAESIGAPERVLSEVCDVSDPEAVKESVGHVLERFARIDALVNNAGIADFKPVTETSFSDWSEILATNLNGPFLCSQACVPAMLAQGAGAIVNITSISGLRASTLRTAYGTSKAALAHLTKQFAAELGHHGIRVNAVAPGPIDTAMAKKVHSAEIRADYHDAIPLNRYGLEQEVANTIYFLCSDESSFITGQEVCVDGGFGTTGIGLSSLRKA
jgi:NAD(P)-dependent dehydrogenase (short-subunit alcohol dehydrogenase family)